MKRHTYLIAYALAGLLFIIFEYLHFEWIALGTKALLMPLLLVWFRISLGGCPAGIFRLVPVALIFSWLGDLGLQVARMAEAFFLAGMAAFLMAQVSYALLFFSIPGRNTIFSKRWFVPLLLLAYGTLLIAYLYPGLGSFRIPVIIYAVAILTMLAGAYNRSGKVSFISYRLVLAGALLFVLSDSLIAINKFALSFDAARVIIMGTYLAAQFLIVYGILTEQGGMATRRAAA